MFLHVLILCSHLGGRAAAQDGVVDDGFEAAAPDTVTEADLGRPYTSLLQRAGSASVFPATPETLRTVERTLARIRYRTVSSETELRANAGVWGLGSASIGAASSRAHSYHRVYLIRRIVELQPVDVPASVPRSARYYLSAIVYGHIYELHFHGNRQLLEGGLSGIFPGGNFDASARRTEQGIEYEIRMDGLEPTNPAAIFATEADVRAQFRMAGDPVPILVRYTPIPGVELDGADSARYELTLRSIRVRETKANGDRWDVGFGATRLPDIRANFTADGGAIACFQSWDTATHVPDLGTVAASIAVSSAHPLVIRLQDIDAVRPDDIGTIRISELAPSAQAQPFRTEETADGQPMATIELMIRPAPTTTTDALVGGFNNCAP